MSALCPTEAMPPFTTNERPNLGDNGRVFATILKNPANENQSNIWYATGYYFDNGGMNMLQRVDPICKTRPAGMYCPAYPQGPIVTDNWDGHSCNQVVSQPPGCDCDMMYTNVPQNKCDLL